jgi:hypothetical protein
LGLRRAPVPHLGIGIAMGLNRRNTVRNIVVATPISISYCVPG